MVCKQTTSSASDVSPIRKIQQTLVPKINQDSFKVMKGFPQNSKPFNWLFELFDGHGPHGELVSQLAARVMPDLLDSELQKINMQFYE